MKYIGLLTMKSVYSIKGKHNGFGRNIPDDKVVHVEGPVLTSKSILGKRKWTTQIKEEVGKDNNIFKELLKRVNDVINDPKDQLSDNDNGNDDGNNDDTGNDGDDNNTSNNNSNSIAPRDNDTANDGNNNNTSNNNSNSIAPRDNDTGNDNNNNNSDADSDMDVMSNFPSFYSRGSPNRLHSNTPNRPLNNTQLSLPDINRTGVLNTYSNNHVNDSNNGNNHVNDSNNNNDSSKSEVLSNNCKSNNNNGNNNSLQFTEYNGCIINSNSSDKNGKSGDNDKWSKDDQYKFILMRRRGLLSRFHVSWRFLFCDNAGIWCRVCSIGGQKGKFVDQGSYNLYPSKIVTHFLTSMLYFLLILCDILYIMLI